MIYLHDSFILALRLIIRIRIASREQKAKESEEAVFDAPRQMFEPGRFVVIRRILATVICAIFMGAFNGYAADILTLEEALDIALKNNPQVKAQNENVQGRLMQKRSAFSEMLPEVNLSYSYTRLNEAPTMILPPAAPGTPSLLPGEIPIGMKDNYRFSVSATQPIYTGGALYNAYKVAGNTHQAADLSKASTLRDLKRQVIEAYYGLIQARQTLEVARSASASIKSHLDVANAFFGQGMIPKNDLLEAEVRYAQSRQNTIQAENATRLSESNLNQLMGRDLSIPIATGMEVPMPDFAPTLDESTQTALANRQELKISELQIDSANKGITISRSGYFPTVAATAAYYREGEDPDAEDDSWSVGVGLTWNIFQGGFTYFDVSRAISDRNRYNYILQAQRNQVGLEVKNFYLSAQEAKARTAVAEKAIDQARENLRIQKDRYSLQVATTTDVLDAESLLDQSRMNYITARTDYVRSLAALRAAMGEL